MKNKDEVRILPLEFDVARASLLSPFTEFSKAIFNFVALLFSNDSLLFTSLFTPLTLGICIFPF